MRLLILVLSLFAPVAIAQTAGDATRGNTPPGMSQDGSRPADGAIKGGSIVPGERAGMPTHVPSEEQSERLKRCEQLTGQLRQQCLDTELSPAAGGSSVPPRPRNKEAPVERELKRSPD